MKSTYFAELPVALKWEHISSEMASIASLETVFSLRRRYNTNHPEEQIIEETRQFRLDQYTKWVHIKDLYAEFRDELVNTLGNDKHIENQSILERILNQDFDNELRKIIKN